MYVYVCRFMYVMYVCIFILYFSMALVHEWHKNIYRLIILSKCKLKVCMHVYIFVMALEMKLNKQYTDSTSLSVAMCIP